MGAPSTDPGFPQFSLLSSEIRLQIWHYCLPRRIVQRDDPFYLVEVREEQKCWSIRPTCQNAALPLIASVCRESRHVVRKLGKLITQDFRLNIGPIWIQPRLDRYNLNCDIRYIWDDEDYLETMYDHLEERFYRLDMMPVSLRAEYFYPFALEPEKDTFQKCPILEINGKPINEYSPDDPYDEFATYIERPYAGVSESATLTLICIHATKEQAADSGLFGILLDDPVQLVDFDDNERLEQFYALFQKGCYNDKRPEVSKQFASIFAPGFRPHVESWREKVDWLMMANAWRRAYKRFWNSIPIEGDPGLIWNPPLLDYLTSEFRRGDTGIAYIYCDFRRHDEQTTANLLASILKQLAGTQPLLPNSVKNLYDTHQSRRTRPSVDELYKTLQSIIGSYSRAFIIVDALDECPTSNNSLVNLLLKLFRLQIESGINIFATARPIPEIYEKFKGRTTIEVHAHSNDVRDYLDSQISQSDSKILDICREDIKLKINLPDKDGRTPLAYAVIEQQESMPKLLLAEDITSITLVDKDGWTPLSTAIAKGDEPIVKLLVAAKITSTDLIDKYSRSPLTYAVRYKQESILRLLLAEDTTSINLPDKDGRTPLSHAAEYGYRRGVKLILATGRIDKHMLRNAYNRTPLFYAARNRHRYILNFFLR